MRTLHKQSGFSAIEVIIVVAVVAVIGFLGYTFYNSYQEKAAKSNESSKSETTEPTPEITSAAGLDEASATMDQAAVESDNTDDLSQLDKEMSEL